MIIANILAPINGAEYPPSDITRLHPIYYAR